MGPGEQRNSLAAGNFLLEEGESDTSLKSRKRRLTSWPKRGMLEGGHSGQMPVGWEEQEVRLEQCVSG